MENDDVVEKDDCSKTRSSLTYLSRKDVFYAIVFLCCNVQCIEIEILK